MLSTSARAETLTRERCRVCHVETDCVYDGKGWLCLRDEKIIHAPPVELKFPVQPAKLAAVDTQLQVCAKCKESDPRAAPASCQFFVQSGLWLCPKHAHTAALSYMQTPSLETVMGPRLSRVKTPYTDMKQGVCELLGVTNWEACNKIPAPMPIAFEKRDIDRAIVLDYLFSFKSDGLFFALWIQPPQPPVLISMTWEQFHLVKPSGSKPVSASGFEGKKRTVLLGELAVDLDSHELTFVPFECLCLSDEPMRGRYTYAQRVERMHRIKLWHPSLEVRHKTFVRASDMAGKSDAAQLLGKPFTKIDGLVGSDPLDKSMQFNQRTRGLLKHKQPDEHTYDVVIKRDAATREVVGSFAHVGGGGALSDRTVPVGVLEHHGTERRFKKIGNGTILRSAPLVLYTGTDEEGSSPYAVVQSLWDESAELFIFESERRDKWRLGGNAKKTIDHTRRVQAEGLTRQALIEALRSRTLHCPTVLNIAHIRERFEPLRKFWVENKHAEFEVRLSFPETISPEIAEQLMSNMEQDTHLWSWTTDAPVRRTDRFFTLPDSKERVRESVYEDVDDHDKRRVYVKKSRVGGFDLKITKINDEGENEHVFTLRWVVNTETPCDAPTDAAHVSHERSKSITQVPSCDKLVCADLSQVQSVHKVQCVTLQEYEVEIEVQRENAALTDPLMVDNVMFRWMAMLGIQPHTPSKTPSTQATIVDL